MTDQPKRGRGRPRKIENFNPSNLQKEVDQVFDAPKMEEKPQREPLNWETKNNGNYGLPEPPIEFTKVRAFIDRPYPKDWDTMSKIEKLKYLTANPR